MPGTLRNWHWPVGFRSAARCPGRSGLNNTIEGNSGDNQLSGFSGDDLLEGNDGGDALSGGSGFDRLEGDSGQDSLLMDEAEVLFGGSSGNLFRFDGNALGSGGPGGPAVRDFDRVLLNAANGEDKLVFSSGLETGSFAYIGSSAFSGDGDSEARFAGTRQVQVDQDGDCVTDQAFSWAASPAPTN